MGEREEQAEEGLRLLVHTWRSGSISELPPHLIQLSRGDFKALNVPILAYVRAAALDRAGPDVSIYCRVIPESTILPGHVSLPLLPDHSPP